MYLLLFENISIDSFLVSNLLFNFSNFVDKEVSDIVLLLTLHDLQVKEKLSHSNI